MRKIIFSLALIILLTYIVSAEILISTQPKELYSLGDTIEFPVKVTSLANLNSLFTVKLICNGKETEVYKEYMILLAGDEKERNPSIPLIESFIGRSTGICKIKSTLGEDIVLTDEFRISDKITIILKSEQKVFSPEETIPIEFEAKKESGNGVNGYVDISIKGLNNSEEMMISETIKNGYGYAEFSFPKETKAGDYNIYLNVSEKDYENQVTNKGSFNYVISIIQIPTSLELILEEKEIKPGTSFKARTILHDQTGEKISSNSMITIKDFAGIIREQREIATDEFLELPISKEEPPKEWTIIATSNELTSESEFSIQENPEVRVEIINKTLSITNIGNVPYNDTVVVKIENISLNVNVNLGLNEEQKYQLSAPDGNYKVEILTPEGEIQTEEGVALTGKSISVKEVSDGIGQLARHPFVWIFILGILGTTAFMIFKKGYKKSFFGHLPSLNILPPKKEPIEKGALVKSANKASLSLSIKGDKQTVSLVCLKIKNLKEIENKKSSTEEILQKIVDFAETKKAATYENQDNLFFILAPLKTKTFANEKSAIDIAQGIQNILKDYNKLAKQKLEFGIAVNNGSIIAKQEQGELQFMSLGTLITEAKKISAISNNDILLSQKIKEKMMSGIKTQKQEKNGLIYYTITEIKDSDKHKKFINNFLNKLESDKKQGK